MAEIDDTGESGNQDIIVEQAQYFDPNAADDRWPGVIGLNMQVTRWRDPMGNEWDTFDALGPSDDNSIQVPTTVSDPLNTQVGASVTEARQGPAEDPGFLDKGMKIVLQNAYGGDLTFPVLPEDGFGAEFSHNNWTPRIVNVGEIMIPGTDDLETITLNSFFPRDYDESFCVISFDEFQQMPTPERLMENLIWTKRNGMVCRLEVQGGLWNDDVVIEKLSYKHNPGEPGDVYYSITFKRYRAPSIFTVPADLINTQNQIARVPSNVSNSATGPNATTDNATAVDPADTVEVPSTTPQDVFPDEAQSRPVAPLGYLTYTVPVDPDAPVQFPIVGPGHKPLGETLAKISEKTGVSIDQIKQFNSPDFDNIDPYGDRLEVGKVIRLGAIEGPVPAQQTDAWGNPILSPEQQLVPGI